jgi:cytochrome c biogenesis protein CcmG, thiol:disulfide interchange protein DsbE
MDFGRLKAKAVPFFWAAVAATVIILAFRPHDGDAGSGILAAGKRRSMPQVEMPDLAGRPWRLSDRRGKVVLVNFWASWCGPCRAETPGLVRLADEYRGRGFELAGVAMDDEPAPVRKFAASYRISYPVLLPQADSPFFSAIQALPTSFLIDKSGRVAATYSGAVGEGELRADVDRLLAEP